MIDRMAAGALPDKPHTAFRDPHGTLRHEECFTRQGFDGEFSILYHEGPPMTDAEIGPADGAELGWALPRPGSPRPLRRRLILGDKAGAGITPVVTNADVHVYVFRPGTIPADLALADGDGDLLVYLFSGKATLESPFGDLGVEGGDYVCIPRSVIHRWKVDEPLDGLLLELRGGLHIPAQFRNPAGQLRMDAPYTHRDFKRPVFSGPRPGPSRILVKKGDSFVLRRPAANPFDVVGWDGFVWPFAFPILRYQPRTGLIHLPPTIHTTFAARGALVCSFVPRIVDFHPQAIPCPYPHSSVDCDEIIYYVKGNFTSRKGVGPKAISLHPAGIPHGPHPGSYEGSIGTKTTDELAVMLDTFLPLETTAQAEALEDPAYHESWKG